MSKSYKDYCREALERDPQVYKYIVNKDGSRKPIPNMQSFYKKKKQDDIPAEELKSFARRAWPPPNPKPVEVQEPRLPELEISGMEFKFKGRKLNLAMMEMPKNPTKKEYNKVWMYNQRIGQRLQKLQDQYGTIIKI